MKQRNLGWRLLGSLLAAAFALVLALGAAHYYVPPNLNGASRSSPWLEPDFCLAFASSLVALGGGLYADLGLRQVRVLGAVLLRALIWLGLTSLLVAAWGNSLSLLTLLIAPSHAFACLRVATLVRAFRSERRFRN